MKALSFLVPILNLIRYFGFIYRIIGIGICGMLFSNAAKDLSFLMTSGDAEPITIEQLKSMSQDDIPRYIKLKDVTLLSDSYVATQDEDTERIISASYPIYSISQAAVLIENADSNGIDMSKIQTHVLVKDKDFSEEAFGDFNEVDGMYNHESFDEEAQIMIDNGINVSQNAILIVKDVPPSSGTTWMIALGTGLVGLLGVLSFVPFSFFGVEEVEEEEDSEEQA